MLALKRFITIVALVYLLLAGLFFLFPAVRSSVAGLGAGYTPTENERNFYQVLAIIGALVLALEVVVENLDSSNLRRTVDRQDSKINELKAKLYDHQTPATSPPLAAGAAVSYPTAADAAQREHRSPGAPGATPPGA